MFFVNGGKNTKRLLIFFLQFFLRPLSMDQGGLAYGTGTQIKSVMLPHTFGRSGKRVFATKIGEHPLQTARFPPWTHSQAPGQRAQITFGGAGPDLFAHRDFSKDTPPAQRFFLRLSTAGSSFLSSCPPRPSAWLAHSLMVAFPTRRISSINSSSTSSKKCGG